MSTQQHEVSEVTRQLIERDQRGRAKYGTSLDRTDLSLPDWLQHMAEELLDAAGYALAVKREAVRQSGGTVLARGWFHRLPDGDYEIHDEASGAGKDCDGCVPCAIVTAPPATSDQSGEAMPRLSGFERLNEWATRLAWQFDAMGESYDARSLRALLAWAEDAERRAAPPATYGLVDAAKSALGLLATYRETLEAAMGANERAALRLIGNNLRDALAAHDARGGQ